MRGSRGRSQSLPIAQAGQHHVPNAAFVTSKTATGSGSGQDEIGTERGLSNAWCAKEAGRRSGGSRWILALRCIGTLLETVAREPPSKTLDTVK